MHGLAFDKPPRRSIVLVILRTRVISLGSLLLATIVSSATGEPPKRVSPAEFGRVFRENRPSLVRVKGSTWPDYATGFVVGVRGEVVFSAIRSPTPELVVITTEGARLEADLLGYDRELAIGVLRARTPSSLVPLRVALKPGLARGDWVIALTHDERGLPEPFAGVVEGDLERSERPKGLVARADVPGVPGSPILSTRGELVGIAVDRGARRTRVLAIEAVVPFLEAVVQANGL
jgi:S1-C subfamily serine protease